MNSRDGSRWIDFAALNMEIKSAQSAADLRDLARTRGADFSAMQHCMICTACTRLRGDNNAACVLCVLAANEWLYCPRGSPGRDARNAATVYYALAKVKAHCVVLPADIAVRINISHLITNVGLEASFMSRDFNAQGAANSLWAAATLGVRDDAIIGPLVAACVTQSRTFNAQGAANSLWAAAALGVRNEAAFRALVVFIRSDVSLNVEECQQFLYVHAATHTWLPAPLLFSPELLDSFRARVISTPSIISRSQRDVAASFSRVGFVIEQEALVLDGLHAVDILVHLPGGARIAVEFDGPTHFLRWIQTSSAGRMPEPNGATCFRNRLLRDAGLVVVAIPYFEWDALIDDAARDAYISLRLATVT